jgi:hypothetical protein
MADGEEETQETVSVNEIRARAREMTTNEVRSAARLLVVCLPQPSCFDQTPIAVNDVSWLDQDSEDERDGPIRIKEVLPAKKQPLPRSALGQVDFDVNFEV